MNITQESTGNLTAVLKVELSKDDYENDVTAALKDYQRKANIPGFRPGKVPFGMIKRMYGNAVMADKINDILSVSLSDYIKDNNIKILGNPLPNNEKTGEMDFQNQSDFEFFFDIGFASEFEIELSDKTEVDYYTIKVDDETIDKYLDDIRKRHGTHEHPEVSEGDDRIYGEFSELDKDGNLLEEGIQHKASLLPEFVKDDEIRKKLSGLKMDDIVIFNPLKATENPTETAAMLGVSKEVAEGITSDFQFKVEEITRVMPAELNEEFYSKVYPGQGIKTEEELREAIKKDAENAYLNESEKHFVNNAIEKLIENSNIELPDEFLKRWLKENNEDKITEEQVNEQYDSFAKSMKWHLIESKISENHDIQVKDEDIRSEIKKYFTAQLPEEKQDEDDPRLNSIVDSVMSNKDEVKKISDKLFDDNLSSLLRSTLKMNEKEVSYEEFIKIASTLNI